MARRATSGALCAGDLTRREHRGLVGLRSPGRSTAFTRKSAPWLQPGAAPDVAAA